MNRFCPAWIAANFMAYGREGIWHDRCLTKLLENGAVARYLRQRQPEVVTEFELIVKTVALDQ
jgi:hypothetical protein